MRAIWKGAVSFGLVNVPVKLYAATESHDVSFRQVHEKDGGRIKYQRICSVDGDGAVESMHGLRLVGSAREAHAALERMR